MAMKFCDSCGQRLKAAYRSGFYCEKTVQYIPDPGYMSACNDWIEPGTDTVTKADLSEVADCD